MQSKEKTFEGQVLYVGIDVHQKNWKVAILHGKTILKRFHQEPGVGRLMEHLRKHYPQARYELGYEAGFCGFWIQREVDACPDANCTVLHAADIPTTDKERRFKTDARDCAKIAYHLASPAREGVHVPDEVQQGDRNLTRLRTKISQDCTRVRNRVKGLIQFMHWPIEIPTYWSNRFVTQLATWAEEQDKPELRLLMEEYRLMRQMKAKVLNQIRLLSKEERYAANVQLLQRIPGLGLSTIMEFLTEVGDVRRFKNLDRLCSYLGLIPNTDSSGEKERVGRITKRGKNQLKSSLIQAAWIAIRFDASLREAYQGYTQRMNGNKAIIRVAKQMVNRMRSVLLHGVEYKIGYEAA